MNATAPDTPGATHDPPSRALSDDEVLIARPPTSVAEVRRTVEHRRAILGSDRYLLLAQKLADDPMNVVRRMAQGEYRFKRRRDRTRWLDGDGRQVVEFMSLRQAAAELKRLTGEDVTYETLRRWWMKIWPDEPDPGTVPAVEFREP